MGIYLTLNNPQLLSASHLVHIVLTQSSDPTMSGSLEERLGKAKSSNSLHPSPQIHFFALVLEFWVLIDMVSQTLFEEERKVPFYIRLEPCHPPYVPQTDIDLPSPQHAIYAAQPRRDFPMRSSWTSTRLDL
jgi:hypothetical protein